MRDFIMMNWYVLLIDFIVNVRVERFLLKLVKYCIIKKVVNGIEWSNLNGWIV